MTKNNTKFVIDPGTVMEQFHGTYGHIIQPEEIHDWIMSESKKRNVQVLLVEGDTPNRTVFLVPNEDLEKLPKDEKGFYLGNDESGFSIFPIPSDWILFPVKILRSNFD